MEDNNIKKYWNTIKEEDYTSSYNASEDWLRETGIILSRKKGQSKMKYIQNIIYTNKLKFASLFLLITLVFAACSMPVTQQQTLGHALIWSVSPDSTNAIQQIENLPWFDNSSLNVNIENVNGAKVVTYKMVTSEKDFSVIQGYKSQLENITAVQNAGIIPLNESVTRPVYAAALNSFFRINVDASDKTDEQVEQEIEKQLRDAGVHNADISFSKDENGMRKFNMKLEEMPGGAPDKGFEIRVKDGNNAENEIIIKNHHGNIDPEKMKNMTDAEIIDIIRKDLNNPNLSEDNVTIEHTDKGTIVRFANEQDLQGMKKVEKRELKIK